jgi:AcrR family transcriptional regulator
VPPPDSTAETPALRADADRNRRRLLTAAREVFAEHGLDVTLDDIARHAGLGVGTAYRRFPNKGVLVEELLVEQITTMRDIARRQLSAPDPIAGLRSYVEEVVELQVADRSLKQVLFASDHGKKRVVEARAGLAPAVTALVDRARDAGLLRDDVLASDIAMITLMLSVVVDFGRGHEPELFRRYLDWLIAALLTDGAPTVHPPIAMDRFHAAMLAFKLGAAPKPERQ